MNKCKHPIPAGWEASVNFLFCFAVSIAIASIIEENCLIEHSVMLNYKHRVRFQFLKPVLF